MVRLDKKEILVVLSPHDNLNAWEKIVTDTVYFFPRNHEQKKEHAGCEVMKLYDILVKTHPAVHVPQGSLCYQVEKGLLERLPAGSAVEVKCCYNEDGTITRTEEGSNFVDLLVDIKRAPGDDPQGPFSYRGENPGKKILPGMASSAGGAFAAASASSSSSFSGSAEREAQGGSSAGTAKVEQGGGVRVADAPSQLVRSNSGQCNEFEKSPLPKARIQLYKAPMHKRGSSPAYSDETTSKKMKKDEDASRRPGGSGKNPVADPGKKIARAGNENAEPGLEAGASVKRVDELEKKVAELTSKAASFQKREKEFNDDKERVYKFMLDRNSSRRGVESGTDDAGRSERDYDEIKEEVYKFMKDRQSTRSASGAAVDA